MFNKKILPLIIVFFIFIVFISRYLFFPGGIKNQGNYSPFFLRVLLENDSEIVEIKSDVFCKVIDPDEGRVVEDKLGMISGIKIRPAGENLRVGRRVVPSVSVCFIPVERKGIEVNGILYKGEIIVVNNGKTIDVINKIEMEDYLKGVLPKEIHQYWPFSALCAQAIASRSFAMHEALRRKSQVYDLRRDTYSQVYGGASCEQLRTNRAVEATRGKVLAYNGKVLPAYFHSCCGGYTQASGRLWGKAYESLSGVKCKWCKWSPYYRWQRRISTREIINKLNEKKYQIKNIKDIKAGPRDASDRVAYITIKSQGKWFEISTGEFRSALGLKMLRSSNFKIKKYPTFYLFSGYGWGHGVGLCQWGTFGLALRGKGTEKILKIYYPGAVVADFSRMSLDPRE